MTTVGSALLQLLRFRSARPVLALPMPHTKHVLRRYGSQKPRRSRRAKVLNGESDGLARYMRELPIGGLARRVRRAQSRCTAGEASRGVHERSGVSRSGTAEARLGVTILIFAFYYVPCAVAGAVAGFLTGLRSRLGAGKSLVTAVASANSVDRSPR